MYEESLFKAIRYFGSQQALADAIGVTQQAVNHWINRNKKIPFIQAFKISLFTQGKIQLRELTDAEKELAFFLEETIQSNALPMAYLSLKDIHAAGERCPIYQHHFSTRLTIPDLDFSRAVLIDTNNQLITCECRLRFYQLKRIQKIKAYRLDLSEIITQRQPKMAAIIQQFPISERVAVGLAIEKLLGNRQGKRMDLQLLENSTEVKSGQTTRKIAARVAGFGSDFTYAYAKQVVKNGIPELIQAVDEGLLAISKAKKLLDLPEQEQFLFVSMMHQKKFQRG